MSDDTVKKRGRPKKVASLEEGLIVIEQSSKTKPRKATTKKPIRHDADERVRPTTGSIKNSEKPPQVQLQVDGVTTGRNGPAKTLVNRDVAKQRGLSTAGSAILQKAEAFKTMTASPPFPYRDAPGLAGPEQTTTGNPIAVSAVELNATPAKNQRTTHEQNPSNTIPEQEPQLSAAADLSRAGLQTVENQAQSQSAAIAVIDAEAAPAPQSSDRKSAASMGDGDPAPAQPGHETATVGSLKNTTAASSPPQSKPPPPIRLNVSSKPGPRLPSSLAPPPARPPPPRPTQLPYHELKKNPQFKALSRKYTSLIIAIPIALVTSYVLWSRYTNQTTRRHVGDGGAAERTGGAKPRLFVESPANAALLVKDTTDAAVVQSKQRLLEE